MELTPKQREVLKQLRTGKQPADIAQMMGIRQTTVREHIKGIRRFYGAQTHQEAIKKAKSRGDI